MLVPIHHNFLLLHVWAKATRYVSVYYFCFYFKYVVSWFNLLGGAYVFFLKILIELVSVSRGIITLLSCDGCHALFPQSPSPLYFTKLSHGFYVFQISLHYHIYKICHEIYVLQWFFLCPPWNLKLILSFSISLSLLKLNSLFSLITIRKYLCVVC
jgi:hypothetical protein